MKISHLSVALVSLALPAVALAYTVPAQTGRLTDATGLFPSDVKEELNTHLNKVSRRTGTDIAAVILPTLNGEAGSAVAAQVGNAWSLGADTQDKAILILFSLEEGQIFIAPGVGVEKMLSAAVLKSVIDDRMVPVMNTGDILGGIRAGVGEIEKNLPREGASPFKLLIIGVVLLGLVGAAGYMWKKKPKKHSSHAHHAKRSVAKRTSVSKRRRR